MKLDCIIYTTSKDKWIERDFIAIYNAIKKAPGVEIVPFTVKSIKLGSPVTYTSPEGGVYLDWGWIKANYPTNGHNAVCLHISPEERASLGLKHPEKGLSLGGVYNRDSDDVFDFVVIADRASKSSYGNMSAFTRIFLHELSHGFAHWRGVSDYTHTYDYTLKDIKGIYYTHSFTVWNSLVAQIETLKLKVQSLMEGFVLTPQPNGAKGIVKTNAELLYEKAVSLLGTDASPRDLAPDELGCAETVSAILNHIVPFPAITGTATLYSRLMKDARFQKIGAPEKGAIIISPTGSGNGNIAGHTGICDGGLGIMSNDSATGKFKKNYTDVTWKERYMRLGGFPVHYFRLK